MSEIWKAIEGYEGLYEVSNLGRVRNLDKVDSMGRFWKGKILTACQQRGNYLYVQLSKDGKQKPMKIHRLVAKAFIPNPDNKPQVNHKDCNKANNRADNLEWVTNQENIDHGKRNGRFKGRSNPGSSNGRAKLTESDIIEIRRTCVKGSREYGMVALGEKYGVSSTQINRIVSGESWQ